MTNTLKARRGEYVRINLVNRLNKSYRFYMNKLSNGEDVLETISKIERLLAILGA